MTSNASHDIDLALVTRDTIGTLPRTLLPHLVTQRWFVDKNQRPETLTVVDAVTVQISDGLLVLAIVQIHFPDGALSIYNVPLHLATRPAHDAPVLFEMHSAGIDWYVCDAIPTVFGNWMLQFVADGKSVPTMHGKLQATAGRAFTQSERAEHFVPIGGEQSNSSLLSESLIAKVYRRLSVGENPDVEIGRFLATASPDFATPPFRGSLSYASPESHFTLAMMQSRIASPRDGWTIVVDALFAGEPILHTIGAELGTLTAEMHLALAATTIDARFAAEPASSEVISKWHHQTRSSALKVIRALKDRFPDIDSETADLAKTVIASEATLLDDSDGYSALEGFPLIRVHGDYHLGQVLRDEQATWWVVDFEGEPLRPIAERTRKTSPLKDVAGMLRSFAYARGVAQAGGVSKASLDEWETQTRADFIRSYLSTLRVRMPGLLPVEDNEFVRALDAWELDKSLYEVLYEIASRPDWLWLPLNSIARRV